MSLSLDHVDDDGNQTREREAPPGEGHLPRGREPASSGAYARLSGAAYGALLVLGFVVGVYGAFSYSAVPALGVPWGAVATIVANFLMCWLAGRGMGGRLGAAAPFAGWIVAAVLLSVQRADGDLVITAAPGGYLFIFGGTAAAAVAVALTRSSLRPPSDDIGTRPD